MPIHAAFLEECQEALGALRRGLAVLNSNGAHKSTRRRFKEIARALQSELEGMIAGQATPHVTAIAAHRARSVVRVSQPLMLCSQIQRSGGTLLVRLFDGHPMCFAHPNELRWGKPAAWPDVNLQSCVNPDSVLDKIAENWRARFAALGYYKCAGRQRGDCPRYPFLFDEELLRSIFRAELEKCCETQRDLLNAYLTALFNAWLDYQNLYRTPKRWVVAFEPRLILRRGGLDRFFADYQDGLLVTLIREPGAWLSSYLRHVPAMPVDTALRFWTESVDKSVIAHRARPDRVIVLLFEDLIRNTETTMQLLCDRMAIPFDDIVLQPTYNSMSVLSNSSHCLSYALDVEVTARYRLSVTAEQMDAVARQAAPVYAKVSDKFCLCKP